MPFDILICLFPANPLVIEVLPQYFGYCWRETGFFSCVLHHWGSWALTHFSLFPQQRLPLLDSSAPCSVALEVGGSTGKVPQTVNETSGVFLFDFPSLLVGWNLPLGSLDFCKFSPNHVYLPRSALSRVFFWLDKRVWDSVACSTAHYWINRSVRLLLGPLTYGACSHSSAFVCGWMSNSLFKWEGQKGGMYYPAMMLTNWVVFKIVLLSLIFLSLQIKLVITEYYFMTPKSVHC